MRRILCLFAFSAVFSMLALAENWSGRLLDAACFDQQKKADGCDASGATTSFMLAASGKTYHLDAAGNSKAATALKGRADRSDPVKPASKEVMAKVTGTEKGGTITVESIDIQ